MKVYVIETGCYSNRGVAAVAPSLEIAKAAYPGENWREWSPGNWLNDKDWDSAIGITEYEMLLDGEILGDPDPQLCPPEPRLTSPPDPPKFISVNVWPNGNPEGF